MARSFRRSHGFPLRAIVPGWYAMASVKWLRRIIVTGETVQWFLSIARLHLLGSVRRAAHSRRRCANNKPKPRSRGRKMARTIAANSSYRVHGAAWSRNMPASLASKLVSIPATPGSDAKLLGEPVKMHGVFGNTNGKRRRRAAGLPSWPARPIHAAPQPAERSGDRGTYMINHLLPVEIEVR